MQEIINIQILNGIGHIFMESTGMKNKKEKEYLNSMENTGM